MKENNPYVSIYYKNTTDTPKHALYIPGCGPFCPLNKMMEMYKDILPGKFDIECKVKKSESSSTSTATKPVAKKIKSIKTKNTESKFIFYHVDDITYQTYVFS